MFWRPMLATALLTMAASVASAQELVDGRDAGRILQFAEEIGSAKLGADIDGDPEITGQIDGQKYKINFFGCADPVPCKSLRFLTRWKFKDGAVTVDEVYKYNRYTEFIKAYLNETDEVSIAMEVLLEHGVSVANLKQWFGWWSFHVGEFDDELINN